ncbi:MAG: hypothetical protein Q7J65_00425 [Candidatus Marinimicrobia bacterium]|nr:hypothetical protein [Candidatus Neomarinimicrobiota bacterium]
MKKLTKIRSLLFLWAAVCGFFTVSYYRLVASGDIRTIHKLAVVFWAVQGLIAFAAFVMSLKSKPDNANQDNQPE